MLKISSIDTEAVVRSCSVKWCFKGFTKFTRKYLSLSLIFKKQCGEAYLKETPTHLFSCEFLRTPILNNICEWLLTNLLYKNKPPISKGSLLNGVLAYSRALHALRAHVLGVLYVLWRAYVLGVLHEMACLECFKKLACFACYIKWRTWRASQCLACFKTWRA